MATMAPSRLYAYLSRRWWLALVLMGASFVLFGLMSLNLLHSLSANLEFLGMHGFDAVKEGALTQLGWLLFSGCAAVIFYVFFKLCERVLVERLASTPSKGGDS